MRWSCWFLLACGLVAGVLLLRFVPPGLRNLELYRQHFHLARDSTDLVEITEARWFLLPFLFGDFDLEMDVSLGEGADLDLLLRQVEPRHVVKPAAPDAKEVDAKEVIGAKEPFAGRFTVLRLSTVGDGPGWRTRDEALTGPRGGGVGLASGHLASVWIQARGRLLRANVAGRWQPWQVADDSYGMLTMLTHGGNAEVHRLEIAPRGRNDIRPSPWTWLPFGLLAAAMVLAIGAAVGSTRADFFAAGVALVVFVWWASGEGDLDLAVPRSDALLLVLTAAAAAATAFVVRPMRLLCLVCVVLAAVAGDAGLRGMHHDDQVPEKVFGSDAGDQISEALGQRVRGPAGVHTLEPSTREQGEAGPRVFLLGGAPLYDTGEPGMHVELLLRTKLRSSTGKAVEVLGPQTALPSMPQQWRLFRDFYTGYHPDVLVLGTLGESSDDAAPKLTQVLTEARTWCVEHGTRLVLFAGPGTDAPTLAQLRVAAAADADATVPLVIAGGDEAPQQTANALADAIADGLR